MKRKVIAVIAGTIILGGLSSILHLNFHHWTGYVLEAGFAVMAITIAWVIAYPRGSIKEGE